ITKPTNSMQCLVANSRPIRHVHRQYLQDHTPFRMQPKQTQEPVSEPYITRTDRSTTSASGAAAGPRRGAAESGGSPQQSPSYVTLLNRAATSNTEPGGSPKL